jgi:hypothetical protein
MNRSVSPLGWASQSPAPLPHEARRGSEAGGLKRCRVARYSSNRGEEELIFEVHTTHLPQPCSITIAIEGGLPGLAWRRDDHDQRKSNSVQLI